jgi:hypothetical protein
VNRLTFAHITNIIIERRHKCLTVDGKEECRCGGDSHGGISNGRACHLARGAHSGGQYPWPEGGGVLELWPRWSTRSGGDQYPPGGGGGQYPAGGGGGGHVEGCSAMGDPPHGITSVAPV